MAVLLHFLIRIGLILLALSACLALLNYTLSSSKKKVESDVVAVKPTVNEAVVESSSDDEAMVDAVSDATIDDKIVPSEVVEAVVDADEVVKNEEAVDKKEQ